MNLIKIVLIFTVLVLASLAFAGKGSKGRFTACQTMCNEQYSTAYHACHKDTACIAVAYDAWQQCFYGCP